MVVEHLGVGGAPLCLETDMNLINELRELAEDLYVNGYNRYSSAMSKAADELAKWEAVFGHLGDTPDDCGNAIIAARDELEERCDELSADKGTWYRMSEVFSKRITEVETALKTSEERCATLTDALRSTAQTLAWIQHGECRGFSDDLLATNEALDKARAALGESK